MIPENRRFVDVVVKARRRFEALRDFTLDGALEELDRAKKERKDAGESTGVRSPARNSSLDSARGIRSPALSNLPEDSAFAIGEDEEEDGDGEQIAAISSPASASANANHDALPQQSRSMSEKARGKQPVGQTSFSRSSSRNTSNTSLHTLSTHQSHQSQAPPPPHVQSQQFIPTVEWVSLNSAVPRSSIAYAAVALTGLAPYLVTIPATSSNTTNDRRCPKKRSQRQKERRRRRSLRHHHQTLQRGRGRGRKGGRRGGRRGASAQRR